MIELDVEQRPDGEEVISTLRDERAPLHILQWVHIVYEGLHSRLRLFVSFAVALQQARKV